MADLNKLQTWWEEEYRYGESKLKRYFLVFPALWGGIFGIFVLVNELLPYVIGTGIAFLALPLGIYAIYRKQKAIPMSVPKLVMKLRFTQAAHNLRHVRQMWERSQAMLPSLLPHLPEKVQDQVAGAFARAQLAEPTLQRVQDQILLNEQVQIFCERCEAGMQGLDRNQIRAEVDHWHAEAANRHLRLHPVLEQRLDRIKQGWAL